ncbi:protein lifeguard 2-like [Diabrotica undecimpunctata]|uniref:protein lifeguard 2-like n=1 Tax=Diabrotica undecimpunctata TaxID=50387 RepID=UPI003B63CCF8
MCQIFFPNNKPNINMSSSNITINIDQEIEDENTNQCHYNNERNKIESETSLNENYIEKVVQKCLEYAERHNEMKTFDVNPTINPDGDIRDSEILGPAAVTDIMKDDTKSTNLLNTTGAEEKIAVNDFNLRSTIDDLCSKSQCDLYGPNFPPAPFSYYKGQKIHTEQVYITAGELERIFQGDVEMQNIDQTDGPFSDVSIRNKFIFKVYSIVSVLLLISLGFTIAAIYILPLKHFILSNRALLIAASVLVIVMSLIISCFSPLRRKVPFNYILLFLYNVSFSYLVAAVACTVSEEVVLYAAGVTVLICMVVTFLAWSNIFDITTWGFVLFAIALVVIIFGFISSIVYIFTRNVKLNMAYSCMVVILFTGFLLFDTQLILGKGREMLSPEEYIYAAFTLYTDIIIIFFYLMLILASKKR